MPEANLKLPCAFFQGRVRKGLTTHFDQGDAHRQRKRFMRRIQNQAPNDEDVENAAANQLIQWWNENGGPKYLFLGAEIADNDEINMLQDVIDIQPAWHLRVSLFLKRVTLLARSTYRIYADLL